MSQKRKPAECVVKGCGRTVRSRGLCYGCLKKATEAGTLPPVERWLAVSCWCTRKTVKATRREVMALQTRSCGAAGCEP